MLFAHRVPAFRNGTEGATLRVYLEGYEAPEGRLDDDTAVMLAPLAKAAEAIAAIRQHIARDAPDIVT